jgi:predicted enzyme related to lactoylglutathione lyase
MATSAFVWFHNNSKNIVESIQFYEKHPRMEVRGGPPGMTMFAGDSGPIAGIGANDGKATWWIPYAQVDDVDAATKRAVKLGAEVLSEKTRCHRARR